MSASIACVIEPAGGILGPPGYATSGRGRVEYERPGEDLPIRLRACHTRTQEVPMSTANPTTDMCTRGHEYTDANTYRPPGAPRMRMCIACRSDRFVVHTPTQGVEHFYRNVMIDDASKCWPWQGCIDKHGYGAISIGNKKKKAHRVSYEINVGPIPDGLTLDHVKARGCTTRSCVNPSHLEPVSLAENKARGDSVCAVNARKERCIHGHEFVRRNQRERRCNACNADYMRRRKLALKARANG